jgi:hypothetical protein
MEPINICCAEANRRSYLWAMPFESLKKRIGGFFFQNALDFENGHKP